MVNALLRKRYNLNYVMRSIVLSLLLIAGTLVAVQAEENQVSLAVEWKSMLVRPLPLAESSEKAHPDPGISAEARAATAVDFDDSAWEKHAVPGNWESYGGAWASADGEAVFRISVELPAGSAGKDMELCLGAIDDFDASFVNGEEVGHVDKSVLGFWTIQRVYRVPGRLVKDGRNVIAVRVFDHFGGGGFTGPKEKLVLRPAQ